jgi:hypothetical protein
MPVRAPHLHHALRGFCLGAFALLDRDVREGSEIPFAFEEHASYGKPALYELRPLVRDYVERREDRLLHLEDARIAVGELRREPAARIFARAHAGGRADEEQALTRSVLFPLVASMADACGGFDWQDEVFERGYRELEHTLYGESRLYIALAPLTGLQLGQEADLGGGIRVRRAEIGELANHWPEARNLLPRDFGREPDRLCVLELERKLAVDEADVPDGAAELADAVTALRLATNGAIAAGPVLFETLDLRPYGIRPVLPIAATQPLGDPVRLDAVRAGLAQRLLGQLVLADGDAALGDALDRWELSLFQGDPFRSEQLRESLAALLGHGDGAWAGAMRATALLADEPGDRAGLAAPLQALSRGDAAVDAAADGVRRAIVEVLLNGDRASLIGLLDETLMGLRPRFDRAPLRLVVG